jgi:hypothetical protein
MSPLERNQAAYTLIREIREAIAAGAEFRIPWTSAVYISMRDQFNESGLATRVSDAQLNALKKAKAMMTKPRKH